MNFLFCLLKAWSTNMSGLPIFFAPSFSRWSRYPKSFPPYLNWTMPMRDEDVRFQEKTSRTPKRPRPNTYLEPQEYNSISNSSGILITCSSLSIQTFTGVFQRVFGKLFFVAPENATDWCRCWKGILTVRALSAVLICCICFLDFPPLKKILLRHVIKNTFVSSPTSAFTNITEDISHHTFLIKNVNRPRRS